MVVLDHPYVHQVHYRYCGCSKSDTMTPIDQVLRNRWYPATVTDPGTCATFATLETFRLQNVVGNMNVHDFVTAMERQTNVFGSTGLGRVPVHPELICMQIVVLRTLLGSIQGIHVHVPSMGFPGAHETSGSRALTRRWWEKLP
jgi:hypothetical protein